MKGSGKMSTQSMVFFDEMESPIGPLTILATEIGVCSIFFGWMETILPAVKAWLKKNGLKAELLRSKEKLEPVITQLKEYFAGKRFTFDIPLHLFGTAFQKKVWNALLTIKYGTTVSYKDIAMQIGAPKAVRAVGGANNQNPIPIIIPCHRVIGSNGAMVGYGGGLEKKECLLQLEGAIKKIS